MMEAFWSKLKGYFKKQQHKVLMVGIEGAGSTTIIHKLEYDPKTQISNTTCGGMFDHQVVTFRDLEIISLNQGIKFMRQQILKYYIEPCIGLIFVFDQSDKQTFQDQFQYFRKILNYESLSKKAYLPILIFANKTDINSLLIQQIQEMLHLKQINRPYKVQPCYALIAEGIDEGIAWMSQQLSAKK